MNQNDYFTEKIATLPEDLQDAIRASDHESILRNIQQEYRLHIDQAQILETLTEQLIFGDIDAPQFVNNMFNEAHVSSSVAGDILLKIDMLILKKIRAYLENLEEIKKADEEFKKQLMLEEERVEDDEANMYAEYYADLANTKKEVEQELLDEGILPDGSNITDEMLAKELGITVDELVRRSRIGGIKEAQEKDMEKEPTSSFTLGKDTYDAKAELLQELESPEKSFFKPLFKTPTFTQENKTVNTPKVSSASSNIEKIILPDHQLQNIDIEKPYVSDVLETEEKQTLFTQSKPELQTASEVSQKTKSQPAPSQDPVIKKPTKVVLPTIDPYKEPIE